MKKLLIATTALVATAGMASADITITGHAAAGILLRSRCNCRCCKAKGSTAATSSNQILYYLDISENTGYESPCSTQHKQQILLNGYIIG